MEVLDSALRDSVRQHTLVIAERELLEQTLRGSVQAIAEVLSLVNPTAFTRGLRLKTIVSDALDKLGESARWEVEIASMLLQLGAATMPEATISKWSKGQALDPAEQLMVDRMPEVSDRLLEGIPRLEGVRRIIREQRHSQQLDSASFGGRLLRIASDLDHLRESGASPDAIHATMRQRHGSRDANVLGVLSRFWDYENALREMVELDIAELSVGMVLETEIRTSDGRVVIGAGQVVTTGLLERLANFAERHPINRTVVVSREPGGGGWIS
jgi:hypothetical protein